MDPLIVLSIVFQHARVYNKKGDSHHERRVVATQQHGEVGKGRASTWLIKIAIPPLPPTGLKNCSIIDLWYTLKVSSNHLEKTLKYEFESWLSQSQILPVVTSTVQPYNADIFL